MSSFPLSFLPVSSPHTRLFYSLRAVAMGAEDDKVDPTAGGSAGSQIEDDFNETLITGQHMATLTSTYSLDKEQRAASFGWTFVGMRKRDKLEVALNFEKTNEDSVKSRLRQEALVADLLSQDDRCLSNFLHTALDYGIHEPWFFTASAGYADSLPDIIESLRNKEELDRATILKAATHMFLAIEGLHRAKIIHGNIRPENFVIGSRHNNRKIMLMDFACASGHSAEFSRAQHLPDVTYASRSRQRDFEPTRKDDLESWMYCVMEMYNKELVPWTDEKIVPKASATRHKDMLKLKRAFCTGKMWKAQNYIVPEEFKRIIEAIKKVRRYHSPDYSLTWHLLVTACIRYEVEPFAYFSWNHGNTGNPVIHSKYQTTPVPLQLADID